MQDMRDTMTMSLIQCGIGTNPDEVGETLDDDFICKNSS
jgi:hypothetical protein